jgi:RNA-directed DNA polymerase
LERAFEEVARNGGAAGIDGQTIDEIREQGVEAFLSVLEAELREGVYRPLLVRRVAIPRASGGERLLGVPAVRDRVVQAAVKIVIEPIFEADFRDCSFGFRPRRSTRQACERVRMHVQREQRQVVVDADIEGFFDNLDRGILLRLCASGSPTGASSPSSIAGCGRASSPTGRSCIPRRGRRRAA